MMINNENKKSFARMMKSRAVYVALGVCVLAAGFVSYSVSKVSNVPQTGVPGSAVKSTPLWVR